MSTAEVEAKFVSKLADISTRYDSFMDYNVVFSTSATGLAAYKSAFDADSVSYFTGTWSSSSGTKYTSIIVQVPGTQMVLELCSATTLTYNEGDTQPISLEQRVSDTALLSIEADSGSDNSQTSSEGAILSGLAVNRAASATSMAKLEDFYVDGMGTTKTLDTTGSNSLGSYTKKCFQWTGATMDVCYTQRDDSATKGSWKVGDFEDMLNTVHKNLMADHPFCGEDKWEDNHYAIDSRTADSSKVVSYVNSKNPYHYCETAGPPGRQSTSLHYVWDPTGWGIQLDLSFSTTPSDCSSSLSNRRFRGSGDSIFSGDSHTNPACTDTSSKCPSGVVPTPSPPSPTPPSPTPPSPPTPEKSDDKGWVQKHWYVLAAAGGALAVIIIAGLVYVCYCRKAKPMQTDEIRRPLTGAPAGNTKV
jgi:hypothetical protein